MSTQYFAALDHPLDAAHLTLDATQKPDQSRLVAEYAWRKDPSRSPSSGRLERDLRGGRRMPDGVAGAQRRWPGTL